MIKARLGQRNDSAGAGYFGAPRGERKHNGVDYVIAPGAGIETPVTGTVTKHGYCYNGDAHYRYVEITDNFNHRHRLFYVKLHDLVRIGLVVAMGDLVGVAQDISKRYPDATDMLPHVHYEVKLPDDTYIDPGATP